MISGLIKHPSNYICRLSTEGHTGPERGQYFRRTKNATTPRCVLVARNRDNGDLHQAWIAV
jgi:hypothetical protein